MKANEDLSHTTSEAQTLFISYAHEDVGWAEWVGSTLERNGHKTIVAQWDFKPGSNFVLEMDRAVKECDRVLALLSPAFIVSQYTLPEWAAAFAKDPTGRERRLIPVRVRDCIPEGLLGQVVYVDLVGLGQEDATERLLESVSERRLKPAGKVAFPVAETPAGPAETVETKAQYSDKAFPEPEELGFIDYVVLGISSLERGNQAGIRFADLIQELTIRNLKRAEEFTRLGESGGGAKDFRRVARAAAEGMSQFVSDSLPELEAMGLGWETGLAAWRSTIDLLPEFGEIDEDMLRENLSSVDSMIAAIPRTRQGVERMLEASNRLPRVEKFFTAAKREVVASLETAIRILDRAHELANQVHDSAIALSDNHEE